MEELIHHCPVCDTVPIIYTHKPDGFALPAESPYTIHCPVCQRHVDGHDLLKTIEGWNDISPNEAFKRFMIRAKTMLDAYHETKLPRPEHKTCTGDEFVAWFEEELGKLKI